MNILVTGGLGFIGSSFALAIIEAGQHKVRLFDNLSPQIHGAIPIVDRRLVDDAGIEIVRGDVCNSNIYPAMFDGIDAVVHLAAETGTAQSMYQIAHYNEVNSQATARMLDFLANNPHKIKKIILASSRSIYGEGAYHCEVHGQVYPCARSATQLKESLWNPVCPVCSGTIESIPTPESAAPSPASIYAATKYAQEDLIRIAGDSLNIGVAILRFQNVYGAGQSLNNPYTGILSIFSTRIRRGLSLPIFEDGAESRDFVHVSDVVQAITLALENTSADGGIFNVGSGEPTSVLQIANLLVDAFGGQVRPHITGQYRLGDIRHCYADLSHIKEKLAFEPKISLKEGIKEFSAWVLSQPLPEDGLDRANDELKKRKMMS